MAAGLTASQTVHPAPWFCQKKGQLSGTREIALVGRWGGVQTGARLPRAMSDGEERDLRVQVARVRSSSRSLARLFECSSVWDLGTDLLVPGWCLLNTVYAQQQGVKFRDSITVQQRGAQITMFSSPPLA